MAYDGSGLYSLPSPEYPAVPDTVIDSTDYNTILEDIADALTSAILRNGVAAFTGNQSMGGFKLTNMADAVADEDAVPLAQVNTLITAAEFNTALPAQSASTVGKFVTSDGTNASWAYNLLTKAARTSNTQLAQADIGKFIDITTGGFTQTFAAAATLATGWWVYMRNSSSTDVTLGITLDGVANPVMYPGEARLVQCDGSAFSSILCSGFEKTFSASGTFTKPPGYRDYEVFVQAPGGGGGSGARYSTGSRCGGGGGGAGGHVFARIPASAIGATETVTVGTGGAGGTAISTNDTNGNSGSAGSGNSSFGSLLAATPGSGGAGGNQVSAAGGTAGAAAGPIPIAGTAGGGTSQSSPSNNGTASTTVWSATGGGGGGSWDGSASLTAASGGTSGTSVSATQLAGGAAGSAGTSGAVGSAGSTPTTLRGGTGGGGGGNGTSGTGGTGGAGGRGAGGGGGGACPNGNLSGAGGAGGDGYVWVRGIA